ncbi:MAG TPA: YbdK family carboxylate-amine ligase [Gaiellaceae bacterium]|nr:YbdK family carboxylate-amine ligase [Gaiellaceae bacterium]
MGVEEELLLVDEQTLEPVAAAAVVVERAGVGVKHELMATFVETATGICESPREAFDEVRALRDRVAAAAALDALRPLAIGSHPFAPPDDAPIIDNPDYLEFVEAAGPVARRQGVCGLHVHVGMPDPETCVRAHEGVLPWLPVVLAVAANSPWFRGEETGLLSTRAEVLATLPRSGVPPLFGSWEGWVATMERWQRAGVLKKPTQTWWDVRIHPAHGTLEIRTPDQATDVARTGAIVALVHALAVWAAGGDGRPASRADAHTNRFFASRFGPGAKLIHPDEDRLVPVPELFDDLLERIGPHADERLLAPLDASSCEADRQLEAGDPRAACADAVERSLASPA